METGAAKIREYEFVDSVYGAVITRDVPREQNDWQDLHEYLPSEAPQEPMWELPRELPRDVSDAERQAILKHLKPRRISVSYAVWFCVIFSLLTLSLVLNTRLMSATTELYATRPLHGVVDDAGEINRTIGLATRRDELLARSRELRVEFERTFDLAEIEAYAISNLGMVHAPIRGGTTGVGVRDRAVIPESADDGGLIDMLLEYFGIR